MSDLNDPMVEYMELKAILNVCKQEYAAEKPAYTLS